MNPWIASLCLGSLCCWLVLRSRADRKRIRELEATIDAIIEDEVSSEMVARSIVLESVRREARECGGIPVRGGLA